MKHEEVKAHPLGHVDVHGVSLQGLSHESNHDRFAVADLAKSMRMHHTNLTLQGEREVLRENQGHVFLVADGVSGRPSPAEASSSAARSVVEYLLHELPWSSFADGEPEEVVSGLQEAFHNTQDELIREAQTGSVGLASTLTLAFVAWPHLYIGHVGGSRAYLVRGGQTRRLTRPSKPASKLASTFSKRSVRAGNAVGGASHALHLQVEHVRLALGDTLVLVTDGVLESHAPERLLSSLTARSNAEECCDELVGSPGPDDRTAIVARFLPNEPRTVSADSGTTPPSLQARQAPRRRSSPTRDAGPPRPASHAG